MKQDTRTLQELTVKELKDRAKAAKYAMDLFCSNPDRTNYNLYNAAWQKYIAELKTR